MPHPPTLRFTPNAWAKLQFFCHHGETEIGGFGITSPDDPLLVEDFVTVKQAATCISIAFDDAAVADFFDVQVDAGRRPEQFARIWLHTHPADCAAPSSVDEQTFARVFGGCDWAVLFVLARGGKTYARLRFNVGPGGDLLIPVRVEYARPFPGSDHEGWEREYERNICAEPLTWDPRADLATDDWETWLDECVDDRLLTEDEQREILNDESEVLYEHE